jgi:hypothetical protein
MPSQLTVEEEARLSSAVADVRRLLDALRTEIAEMRANLALPPLRMKTREAAGDAID